MIGDLRHRVCSRGVVSASRLGDGRGRTVQRIPSLLEQPSALARLRDGGGPSLPGSAPLRLALSSTASKARPAFRTGVDAPLLADEEFVRLAAARGVIRF